jgi:hypothetical protein
MWNEIFVDATNICGFFERIAELASSNWCVCMDAASGSAEDRDQRSIGMQPLDSSVFPGQGHFDKVVDGFSFECACSKTKNEDEFERVGNAVDSVHGGVQGDRMVLRAVAPVFNVSRLFI